jgi:flagellar basal-body rod protein FlgF
MISGMFSAASALDGLSQNQDVVAENLAHASVPGYRRRGLSFDMGGTESGGKTNPAPKSASGLQGPGAGHLYSSFEPGTLQYTNNPLDLAIKGDGFFVVDSPSGPMYTRNGCFALNPKGELVSAQGMTLQGSSGTLRIPPSAAKITISANGSIMADKTSVGQVKLVRFADPKQLETAGTTLFTAPADAQPQPAKATVEQGYREGSNVQIVNEMVSMIAGMRHYEALQHTLKALSDAIQQNTRPQSG